MGNLRYDIQHNWMVSEKRASVRGRGRQHTMGGEGGRAVSFNSFTSAISWKLDHYTIRLLRHCLWKVVSLGSIKSPLITKDEDLPVCCSQ